MIALPHIELLHDLSTSTRDPNVGQTSDNSKQSFSESLRIASKPSSEGNAASDSTSKSPRKQKSTSGDANSVNTPTNNQQIEVPLPIAHPMPLQQFPSIQQAASDNSDATCSESPVEEFAGQIQRLSVPSALESGSNTPNQFVTLPANDSSQENSTQRPLPLNQSGSNLSQCTPVNMSDGPVAQIPSELSPEVAVQIATKSDEGQATKSFPTDLTATVPPVADQSSPATRSNTETKGKAGEASDALSPKVNIPVSISPDQPLPSAGISSPEGVSDQLAALMLPTIRVNETAQVVTGVSGQASTSSLPTTVGSNGKVSPKDGGQGSVTDSLGLKPRSSSATNQPMSDGTSTNSAASGVQGVSGNASQGQNATQYQVDVSAHAAASTIQLQNTNPVGSDQSASKLPVPAGHESRVPDNAGQPSTAPAQAVPVINSAKLIQSMGQSEMRVGMRSNEFGNISISTSANRDSISAQISLDHSELAKALAAHLPEMQARLGNVEPHSVRIDLNGSGLTQDAGTRGGNDSAQQSQGNVRQSGRTASNQLEGRVNGQSPYLAPAIAARESGSNARLDITV